MKASIAGLSIDSITKKALLQNLAERLKANQKTFVVTPYSEFLYHALREPKLLDVFNRADFSIPDGIGIFWAHKFLSLPLTATNYYGRIFQAFWQALYCAAAIILNPSWVYKITNSATIPLQEKIPGSDLIWDIAILAAQNNQTIYLLGGHGDTPKLAAEKLKTLKIHGREILESSSIIAGYSNKEAEDKSIITDIQKAAPDILLVAFGPIKQEQWILEHMDQLPCKLYIGLGGTFDYLAGNKIQPPVFIRSIGLEWLWRLITQPTRVKRIFNAVLGLMNQLVRYKFFSSLPYRNNVVSVIINKDGLIFVAKRNPEKNKQFGLDTQDNFWLLPQGGVDTGESLLAAAKRETQEETGMTQIEYISTSSSTYFYDFNFSKRFLLKNKHHPFRGQLQHILYFRYTGTESEITLDPYELLEYKWVPVVELVQTIHETKRAVTTIAQHDLIKLLEKKA